jgi:hypothetical protein
MASFGELSPLTGSVEEFSPYPSLEFGNALGQRRLRDVHPLRGQRKAAERGGKVESFELLESHGIGLVVGVRRRRIPHHLAEACLPPGKTLDNFDFAAVPMVCKSQVITFATGGGW